MKNIFMFLLGFAAFFLGAFSLFSGEIVLGIGCIALGVIIRFENPESTITQFFRRRNGSS